MRKAILLGILFIASHGALAQSGITLRGTLKDDKGQPVANTQISVRGDAFSNTKPDGQFAIALTNQVVAGQTITLLVSKDRWIINDPVDGKWNVPSARFFAEQRLPVTIVPYGSPALLTPARLNEQFSRIKDELTRKLNKAREHNRSLAARDAENKAEVAALKQQVMSGFLRRWEKAYGLTVAKMEEVISQYARTVNPADDNFTKGMKEFYNSNYAAAANLLRKSGDAAAARAQKLREEAALEDDKAFYSYKAAGDALSLDHQYKQAIAAYDRAAEFITQKEHPQEWALLETTRGIVRLEIERELARLSAFNNWKSAGDAYLSLQKYELAMARYDRAAVHVSVEHHPQEWAELENVRGKIFYVFEDWEKARQAYANVLSVKPDLAEALERLSVIYHERLFRLPQAFALNERRVKLEPDNLSAQSTWAENHFTTTRFAEAETRLAVLIANPKLDASTQTALRVIEIANALALGKAATVKPKLEALLAAVAQQPADFRVGWSFNGTLHFIGTHEALAARRDWLRQLIAALQAENRDAILTGLRAAQKQFVP